ncbi:MAG: efflux RND transporter periplasmic adaptor subunit [Gammaproteobacteria bacterium]|nr:efflux RND transporter periplasmic adaptor subunit [Gammaproteobacteria bacterium]
MTETNQTRAAKVTPITKSVSSDMKHTTLPRFDLHALYTQLLDITEASIDRNEFLFKVLQRTVAVTNALGAIFFVRDESGELTLGPRLFGAEILQHCPDIAPTLAVHAKECALATIVRVESVGNSRNHQAILVPVVCNGRDKEVLCVVASIDAQSIQPFVAIVQLVAGYINLWAVNQANNVLSWEADTAATLVDLITCIQGYSDLDRATLALVNELKQHLGCARVAIGFSHGVGGRCRLKALSEISDFDKRADLSNLLEAVFSEAITAEGSTCWPGRDGEVVGSGLAAHSKLQTVTGADTVISTSLDNSAGEPVGAIALWWVQTLPNVERTRNAIDALSTPLGVCLDLIARARPGFSSRLGRVFGGWRALGLAATLTIFIGLMLYPVEHRISAKAELQPVIQRVVSAPFDGVVKHTQVAPGDIVQAKNVLARLDGREIQWQLQGLRADYDRAAKQHDITVAEGSTSGAQVARLEMERIEVKIQLLEYQAANLDIRSPIDGVLIGHALERKEGSPVSKGDALFEVAPLQQMVAEVAIAVEDISYVQPEMELDIRLDAFPDRQWRKSLGKLRPRADVQNGQNVFLAEVEMANEQGKLRPGMKGDVRLIGDTRALGWVLFHRPWERLVGWFELSLFGTEPRVPGDSAWERPTTRLDDLIGRISRFFGDGAGDDQQP